MIGLLPVQNVRVPQDRALEAHDHLRQVGRHGAEAVALWAGTLEGTIFEVRKTIIPKQVPHRTPTGVYFTVSPQELHRINVWLHENEMQLIAQLHSHPREAYHSELDDELPIATTAGCLSLVIPNFAREPFALARCAVYRLMPHRGWVELTNVETSQLIAIINDVGSADRSESAGPTATPKPRKTLWDWLRFSKKPR